MPAFWPKLRTFWEALINKETMCKWFYLNQAINGQKINTLRAATMHFTFTICSLQILCVSVSHKKRNVLPGYYTAEHNTTDQQNSKPEQDQQHFTKVKNIQSYHIINRKSGSSILMWGCFSSLTAVMLISMKGTINSFKYQSILEQFSRLLLKNL